MIRTWDPQIRNLVLYPAELPGRRGEFYQTARDVTPGYNPLNAMLAPDSLAPDFCLPDERNEAVSLASLLAAGPLVLYFYPADFTPGCTRQACVMRDLHGELAAAGLRVAGVSPQGPESHARFRAEYGLPFVLLSDTARETIRRFAAAGPFGIGVRRITYLIEPLPDMRAAEAGRRRGRIVDALRADLRIGRHEAFVRRALGLAAAG